MKLEIEEHVEAARDHQAHRFRARCHEELLADLEPALRWIETVDERERRHRFGEIKRDDDFRI